MRKTVPALLIAMSLAAAGASASAETILGQWNANPTDITYVRTSAGTNSSGTALAQRYINGSLSGMPVPHSSVVTQGTPTDPGTDVSGTIYNRSYTISLPLTSESNLARGGVFNVSSAGMNPGEAVQLSWSMTVGFRSSRYWQLLASTDGTNFSPVPVGVGSSVTQTVSGFDNTSSPISGTGTATVSSTGLVDIQTIDQNYLNAASTTTAPIAPYDLGFINDITFTLPTGQGFENNPNFAFAIVGAFDPNYVGTDGAVGYISSFAGTDSSDTVNGYNRSTFSGGSMKMDMVTVSAVSPVPEPASVTLLGLAALCGLGFIDRRRRLQATR